MMGAATAGPRVGKHGVTFDEAATVFLDALGARGPQLRRHAEKDGPAGLALGRAVPLAGS
jgi:uncharacterized DUF497 family protein